jgi:uncharacterized OB-fold protein
MSAAKAGTLANADSQPYWDGAAQGKLVIKTCVSCGRMHFPPRYLCPYCWSNQLEWREHSGEGHVYSFTIVRRAAVPGFETPYVLAMVDLTNGPRLMSNIVGTGALDVGIGDDVRVIFEARDGTILPLFCRQAPRNGAGR